MLANSAKIMFAEKVSKGHLFMGGNAINCRISGKEVMFLQYLNTVLTQTCHPIQSQMQSYQNLGKPEQSLLACPGEKKTKE